jgi:N-acetylmuramate 1-kinase
MCKIAEVDSPVTSELLELSLPGEWATHRLGESLARLLRPGDVVLLHGDLGAGKSSLARAILRTLGNNSLLEVPSPTFALVQPYANGMFRFPVLHADLYRLQDAREVEELGLLAGLDQGALLVEWPERAASVFPGTAIHIFLDLEGDGRRATLSTENAGTARRLRRLIDLRSFIDRTDFAEARRTFLQGDASPRAYERLIMPDGTTAVLLDADANPDVRPTQERVAYMAATHLVPNENVGPVLAINAEFERRGFSVPSVYLADVSLGAILMEDLGSGRVVDDAGPIPDRYAVAVDTLAEVHGQTWPEIARTDDGVHHALPVYDRTALSTEASIMVDKFLPIAAGRPVDPAIGEAFRTALEPAIEILCRAPATWTMMDFHSPNLVWLADRTATRRIGLLDLQDARRGAEAYDVVSLLQDARVTVEEGLERDLLARYLTLRRADRSHFDEAGFLAAYAAASAQRNSRLLGLFVRLSLQDGKHQYLRHIPRISGYLERAFRHPAVVDIKAWYDRNAPESLRGDLAGGKTAG